MDTLRLRLEMKRLQLVRLHAQLSALPAIAPLVARVALAREAVEAQLVLAPDAPSRSIPLTHWLTTGCRTTTS